MFAGIARSVIGHPWRTIVSRSDTGKLTSDDQQKVKGLVSTLNNDKLTGVSPVSLTSNALCSNGKVMVAL